MGTKPRPESSADFASLSGVIVAATKHAGLLSPVSFSEPKPLAGTLKLNTAKALYDYEATCSGELTISLGEMVQITNKDTGSDAWWEGVGKNGKGQFPASYVEEISADLATTPRTEHSFSVQSIKGFAA
jgi:SH3 domain